MLWDTMAVNGDLDSVGVVDPLGVVHGAIQRHPTVVG
jgi:hypothetical protein